MNHIAVIGLAAQVFEHWDDAVQHVAAVTAMDRASLWMGGTTGGVWIFAGRNAAREGRTPLAWITSRLDYQMAKSRGDLADLSDVHAFFSRRAGVSRSGPALIQTLEHLTATPMPTKAPAETVRLHVTRPLTWKGSRYAAKDTLVVSLANMEDQHIKAWLTHGWVHDLRNGEPPKPVAASRKKAGKPIPQTLSAELPAIVVDGAPPESVYREIALLEIFPSPHNPRKRFDADALRELADSIRSQGIIQPIVVRPRGAGSQHDGFEIIAGERRYRAATLAGLKTVPCLVRRLDDAAAALAQGIENLQRADLDPMEECEGYELLMRQAKLTVPQIAQKTGRSEASIYARLKLQECPPGLKTALREGRVPASTAELVARQEDPVFRNQCMDAILHPEKGMAEEGSEVLSFRQAKAWIEEKRRLWQHEEEWRKTAKGSHVAKTASRVLNVIESNEVLYANGYLRDSRKYVKPTERCYDDPEHRTFAEIAEASGVKLPAPILAREPGEGKAVVLLPRAAVEKAIAPVIPDAAEAKRRREAAEVKRREEQVRAQERRNEKERAVAARATAVVGHVKNRCVGGDDGDEVLRFAVGGILATLAIDEDDLAAALRDLGVPVEKGEEATVAAPEWRQEYLRGCDGQALLAWLMWFAIHDAEFYDASIDEDRLWEAEVLLGLREPGPQPSADEDDEDDEAEDLEEDEEVETAA